MPPPTIGIDVSARAGSNVSVLLPLLTPNLRVPLFFPLGVELPVAQAAIKGDIERAASAPAPYTRTSLRVGFKLPSPFMRFSPHVAAQIGRASCRERVEIAGVARTVKKRRQDRC